MTPTQTSGVHSNILDLIGNTPIVQLKTFDTGLCQLFVKLESNNPGGSIKDRPALAMIEAAEREGKLKPGGLIIEATAGNTGLGLALVANQKGYRLRLVLPDKMSQEKIFHLKAVGVEIVMTRSDVQKGHPDYYQDLAKAMAEKEENAIYINQFANPANVYAHYTSTGPEILQQMQGQLDAFVCGVGTGGTLTGIGRYFKEQAPHIEMILADPKGSILKDYVETGHLGKAGSWLVEGIGEDYIPSICDMNLVKKAYTVSDKDAFLTARELLLKEGILAGSSSGTLVCAALRYCRDQTTPKKVLTLICDSGNKYFSKMYNDYWMLDHGFIHRQQFGDLRDLISHRHWERATHVIEPNDTLLKAYNKMRMFDVSQLPVLENNHIVGIIDESDILLAVYEQHSNFNNPVYSAMVTRLEKINYDAHISELMPMYANDHVAIVMKNHDFLGLITRIDLLNFLRRKLNHW